MVDMNNGNVNMMKIEAGSSNAVTGIETSANYRTLWGADGLDVKGVDTAAEAMVAAGLDWTVSKQPLIYKAFNRGDVGPAGTTVFNDAYADCGHYGMIRSSDRSCLGVVGARYEPVQNHEAFNFVDKLVHEGHLEYEIAGSLKGGSKIWLQAKLNEYEVAEGDTMKNYLLLYNTHNGTGALKALFTDVRVWCSNTANAAVKNGSGISLRHTPSVHSRLNDAAEVLGFITDESVLREEQNKWLVGQSMNTAQLTNFVEKLIPVRNEADADKITKRGSTRADNRRAEIINLFEHGTGNHLAGVRGTRWAAYNAVTEYINYEKKVKGEETTGTGSASRMESALFGQGAKFIKQARGILMAA